MVEIGGDRGTMTVRKVGWGGREGGEGGCEGDGFMVEMRNRSRAKIVVIVINGVCQTTSSRRIFLFKWTVQGRLVLIKQMYGDHNLVVVGAQPQYTKKNIEKLLITPIIYETGKSPGRRRRRPCVAVAQEGSGCQVERHRHSSYPLQE